jgi:hypothetical protein
MQSSDVWVGWIFSAPTVAYSEVIFPRVAEEIVSLIHRKLRLHR